jgi:uncharacterized protein (TIGR03083 family)
VTDRLAALERSVDRLRDVVRGLDPDRYTDPAYPTAWSIADVLSHLGSGAVILLGRLEDTLAGVATADDAAQAVWERWNAKSPTEQVADALVADRALVARLAGLTDGEASGFEFVMGPMTFDLDGFVGLRLNEHVLHLWDVEVALDPEATLPADAAAAVADNLDLIVRFTGIALDEEHTVTVATTGPPRAFVVTLGPGDVRLTAVDAAVAPDLALPTEALVRLVYGRLDPDHTPPVRGSAELDVLRAVFPGP